MAPLPNRQGQGMTYDFVIVGAGSAGCLLANRLSANPAHRVLLLEAGPSDWDPMIHMPAGLARLVNHRFVNWNYDTEPERQLYGRRLWWPRGKVLGGSSSINAMCYIRGVPADYDRWATLTGDPGWAWRNVLPLFVGMEDNSRGADALHGQGGPLGVSDLRHHNPLSAALIDAAGQSGHVHNLDFNGTNQAGFGLYQVTQRNGARCSAASAFLAPIRARRNLTVHTGARALRVLMSGARATGVQFLHRGSERRAEAGSVVLAGGAINSPQLLMLSGIGPADHLRDHGINVHLDLPGVGGNLQDHLDICSLVGTDSPLTYDRLNELAVGWRFLRHRDGIGSSNIAEAGGFVRSRLAPDKRCDLQFHFVPALLDNHGRHRLPGRGYTLHACPLHPRSRGRLRLHSADPRQPIAIEANYLGDADGHDLTMMREALRVAQEILAMPAFDAFRGPSIFPEPGKVGEAALEDFIRRKAETIYHPVGTCRMGTDAGAVLDSHLRVHGAENIHVVDASAMPELPSGNTNAPTLMIAERAARLILNEAAPRPA
jgi:choline dehydrogenase